MRLVKQRIHEYSIFMSLIKGSVTFVTMSATKISQKAIAAAMGLLKLAMPSSLNISVPFIHWTAWIHIHCF